MAAIAVAIVCAGCATGQTGSPDSVSESGAVVAGKVVSTVGGQVEYWIQYGPTTAYGAETSHQTITVAQNALTTVRVTISGLARSTTYHYRICAQDSQQQGGPGCGIDRTFKTQSVACGDTVTTDVRLTGTLECDDVSQPGLVVGANGIEINLAGKSIIGAIFVGGSGPPGIDNSGGFDDVTIRNGGVGGEGTGILMQDASRNRVLDVTATGAGRGVAVNGGADNEIRNSNIFGRSLGIMATGTPGLVIADTTAGGSFDGAMVVEADRSRIVRNEAVGAGDNAFSESVGIEVDGSDSRVVDNRVGGWARGNLLVLGSNDVVAENDVFGGSSATGGRGDGIVVLSLTSGTLLRANTAHENDDDGIQVDSASTRLKDNSANSNGDFGIDAVAGVTDLGGNTASGNGNPLQCRNVFCP